MSAAKWKQYDLNRWDYIMGLNTGIYDAIVNVYRITLVVLTYFSCLIYSIIRPDSNIRPSQISEQKSTKNLGSYFVVNTIIYEDVCWYVNM